MDEGTSEYAEFNHDKGHIFTDFEAVRNEISKQTERLAGREKGVTDKPIFLTIWSKNVVDLTMVDLPGLTKVPVKGQAPDIEYQIRALVTKYIVPPNALILAISPANADLAISDAL